MIPASKTYGVFKMKKKQVLIGCAVVIIMAILVWFLLGTGNKPHEESASHQQKIESDTEGETPLVEVKPENNNNTDSVDDDSISDSQTGNTEDEESRQGANPDTDKQDTDTGKQDKEGEEDEKDEDKSESKPIELPFIPAD